MAKLFSIGQFAINNLLYGAVNIFHLEKNMI